MTYGRFDNNILIEIFNVPDGLTIKDCFHDDVGFVKIPNNVELHSVRQPDGSFVPPIPREPIPEVPETITDDKA
jgi:hypothetical protein